MRLRPAILLALVLVLVLALTLLPSAVALAGPSYHAQVTGPGEAGQDGSGGDPTGPDDEGAGQEEQDEAGEGGSQPGAETGAGGQTEEAAEETGPPWTYQMARISLFLLLLLGLGIFLAYRKLVMSRQRAGV